MAFTDLHEIEGMFEALSGATSFSAIKQSGLRQTRSIFELRAYHRAYYAANRTAIRKRRKSYRATAPAHCRELDRAYRALHLDACRERNLEWTRRARQDPEYREVERARERERKGCKPRAREKQARYRERHLYQVRAKDKEYSQRPEVREKRIAYLREYKKRPEVKAKRQAARKQTVHATRDVRGLRAT